MTNRRAVGPGPRNPAAVAGVALALVAVACASNPPPAPRAPAASPPAAAKVLAAPAGPPEGPPVTLLPVATARPFELCAISVSSADRLLTNGAALVARAVPLPIDPSGLRDMLLGQAGLAPEVAANLDLASPSSAAIVTTGHGSDTGVVIAVAARGPAEAERVIGALGKVVMRRGAIALIDNGTGGRGWVFRAGNVVVLSDKLEALARGAMLALQARHTAPEDVTAVLYPDAIARANGTDVRSAVAFAVEAIRSAQAERAQARADAEKAAAAKGEHPERGERAKKGARKPSAEEQAAAHRAEDRSLEMAAEMLGLVADVETAEIGLSADPTAGLLLRTRLHPREGSTLAGVARDTHPYELDRWVLDSGGTPPAVVFANSFGPFLRRLMGQQRDRLASDAAADPKDKSLAAALAFFDAMITALSWQSSAACTFAPEVPHFSSEIAYPLKDAASAAKLGAALGALDHAALTALWNAQVGQTPPTLEWTARKETVGKVKAIRYTVTFHPEAAGSGAAGSNDTAQALTKLFGRAMDAYIAVVGTRFVATVGRNAKARLAALASGKAATPPPPPAGGPLANALAATSGRDGFFYLDLGSLLSLVGAFAQDPRAALLAQGAPLPIPIFGALGGDGAGKVWTGELTIPPAAFVGAGAVIQRISTGSATGASLSR